MKKLPVKVFSRKRANYFWVIPEFLEVCPFPNKLSTFVLLQDYNINRFLHNESERASDFTYFGMSSGYYLNGKVVSEIQFQQQKFHNKLEALLED